MKGTLTGVILSGLVVPGLGQMVQRRYVRGAIMMTVIVVALAVLASKAVSQGLKILETLAFETGDIDFGTMVCVARQVTSPGDSLIMNTALVVIIICWVVATVDAFRTGWHLDHEARTEESSIPGGEATGRH